MYYHIFICFPYLISFSCRHIAGLTEKKADKIIEHRLENGPFRTRKDLLSVKSIGEKTFVQCAG